MEIANRRVPAGVTARWAKQEILRQMMAAANLVATDEVRVLALEIDGREDGAAEDLASQARGVGLDHVEDTVGVDLLDLVPMRRRDRTGGIACDFGGEHAH